MIITCCESCKISCKGPTKTGALLLEASLNATRQSMWQPNLLQLLDAGRMRVQVLDPDDM